MADRAFLRGICRVYKDQRHTSYSGLISQELPELIKAPGVVITSLRLPNRDPSFDSLKIFKGNQTEGVFSLRDQSSRYSVIHVSGKPGHSSRKLLEMPLCTLCSTLLESALQDIRTLPGISYLLAGMDFPITVYSEVLYTKIDAKNPNRIIGGLFRNLDHNSEIEDVFNEYKIGLASYPVQPGFLIDSDSDRDKMPAFKSDQGNALKSFPCEDTRIVNDSTIGPKLWPDRLVSLVGFNHFRNCSDSELRGKAVSLTNRIIDRLVEFNLVGLVHKESSSSNIITGFIEAVHGIQEQLMLFGARVKPDHQGLKHCTEEGVQLIYNYRCVGTPLLPGLKTGVSGAEV